MARLRLVLVGMAAALLWFSHVAQQPVASGAAVSCVLTASWLPKLRAGGGYHRLAWCAALPVLLTLGYFALISPLLTLLSTLAMLVLAGLFLRTLGPGQVPLVTAIGEASRGPLDPAMRAYTRWVTVFWGGFLVAGGVFSGVCLLRPSLAPWHGLPLVMTAMVFIAEYGLRRVLFPQHNHPTFIAYVFIVARAMTTRPNTYRHAPADH